MQILALKMVPSTRRLSFRWFTIIYSDKVCEWIVAQLPSNNQCCQTHANLWTARPRMGSSGRIQLTSPTGSPNWPAINQKTAHYQWYWTNRGPQLTYLGPKTSHCQRGALTDLQLTKKRHATNGTVPTGGPNWPSLIKKTSRCQRGAQLTCHDPKNVTLK